MDRLAAIFERFHLRARVFHSGALCRSPTYSEESGCGFVHVLKQGRMTVRSPDGQSLQAVAPSLLFYLQPATHQLIPQEGEETVTVCGSIDFGEGLENPITQVLPPLLHIPLNDHPSLQAIIDLLYAEAFADDCGRQAAMNRICELLIIQLLRHALANEDAHSGLLAGLADTRLALALTAIHKAPAENWGLENLAKIAGMSRASFAAKFHTTVGMTPGEYLSHWRLGVAKSLLRKGQPVTLVADQVGYNSAAAFSRAFSTRFGLPPSTWVKHLSPSKAPT